MSKRFGLLLTCLYVQLQAQSFSITPDTFVPGKTYTIAIQAANCTAGTKQLADVTVLATGSGLTNLNQVNKDKGDQGCLWTGTVSVNQDAEFSDSTIILQWKDKAAVSIPVHIVAKTAGPIPPGLKPTVDVAWKVISRKVSSDNFGARITKLYYPIEVAIGNNSGYDIQLASIQFELPANGVQSSPDRECLSSNCVPSDSYFVVRSSLEREQSIGLRNTTVNIIRAIGPILTGSTVFFNGASLAAMHHKTTFQGIINVFSNPFEKGFELVFPDETVRQLINLDNHSLRDGLIIANNTQIRSIVFVDQDLITRPWTNALHEQKLALRAQSKTTQDPKEMAKRLGAPTGSMNAFRKKDYDPLEVMAQLGSLKLVGRSIYYLNRVSVISNAPGPAPLITGKTGDSATEGGDPVTLTLTGDSLAGAKLTSPDPNLVITNPTAGDGGKSFTATIDPKNAAPKIYQLMLSTASGTVSVPFTVNPADISIPAPSPAITVTAGEEKKVDISGTNLKNVAKVEANCTGITVTNDSSPDGKTLPVKIVALDSAPANADCKVTVTGTSGKTAVFSIAVTAKPPVTPADIAIKTPSPAITVAAGDPVKTVTLKGTALKNVTKIETACKGITVTNDPPTDDTALTVKITADDTAPANAKCMVTVTGKSGNTQTFPIAVTAKKVTTGHK